MHSPALAGSDLVCECKKNRWTVRADRRFAVGELVLVPLINSLSAIQADCMHPHAVPTTVTGSNGKFFLVPSVVALTDDRAFLPPFWLVERTTSDDHNMIMGELEIDVSLPSASATFVTGSNGRMLFQNLKLPVMTNARALDVGSVLPVRWQPRQNKAKKKATPKTWKSEMLAPRKATQ